jgi:hypothetical protein
MNDCSRPTCFVPDTGCDLGHISLADCPAWTSRNEAATEAPKASEHGLLPWSGRALGLSDLVFLAGRARPFVVGVVGPYNAGKTTLLAAWYLLTGRGAVCKRDRQFAGSYSLAGWESVAGSLRWTPGQPLTFPPHTSSKGGRAPGLLHLAFRECDGSRPKDFLFTDAPGEWFQKWALNRDSPEAAGAQWIADHADILLLAADRGALAGESMGTARNSIQLLARRIAAERRGRPIALVWKIVAPEEDTQSVGRGLLELLDWILNARREKATLSTPVRATADPLFLYGVRP